MVLNTIEPIGKKVFRFLIFFVINENISISYVCDFKTILLATLPFYYKEMKPETPSLNRLS